MFPWQKNTSVKQTKPRLYLRDASRLIFRQILCQDIWQRAPPGGDHFIYKIITTLIETSSSGIKYRPKYTSLNVAFRLMPP